MNEQKLRELYNAEIENSAPDFDALWTKIENNLEPKAEIKITPKKSGFKSAAAILASAACIAFAVMLTRSYDISLSEAPAVTESAQTNAVKPEENDIAMEEAVEEEAVSEGFVENSNGRSEILNYNELSFDSYSETILTCNGTPYGDSYFVEENVLEEADSIVKAKVMSVFLSEDGEGICYELEIHKSYPEETVEAVVVESRSPYTMRRGREYLIPLKATDNGYRTVFDNIPQIEFTSDGGLVYYNGWSTLDNESSESIIYPQITVDDFFYDRMKFSYSGDISFLIEKFMSLKAL